MVTEFCFRELTCLCRVEIEIQIFGNQILHSEKNTKFSLILTTCNFLIILFKHFI